MSKVMIVNIVWHSQNYSTDARLPLQWTTKESCLTIVYKVTMHETTEVDIWQMQRISASTLKYGGWIEIPYGFIQKFRYDLWDKHDP